MNFLKRSVLSVFCHWKNTLLLFCIFLVLAALILSGLCIGEACRKAEEAIRMELGADVFLQNTQLSDEPEAFTSVIDDSVAEYGAALPDVEMADYCLRLPEGYSQARLRRRIWAY